MKRMRIIPCDIFTKSATATVNTLNSRWEDTQLQVLTCNQRSPSHLPNRGRKVYVGRRPPSLNHQLLREWWQERKGGWWVGGSYLLRNRILRGIGDMPPNRRTSPSWLPCSAGLVKKTTKHSCFWRPCVDYISFRRCAYFEDFVFFPAVSRILS